jgi:DNA (cytosine-5)-methyltransferase 1
VHARGNSQIFQARLQQRQSNAMRFIDLFAGLGGFHAALSDLGHECVFASEIDDELRDIYRQNFPEVENHVHGDIRIAKSKVPPHDVLCAGFPCQPFSKSGYQLGLRDETRGTLFHEILEILEHHRPSYIILENVGNFERHDQGRTWAIVQQHLKHLGYDVRGTVHRASAGHGLISPHHFDFPHHRERFFIVGKLNSRLPVDPFPRGDRKARTSLIGCVQSHDELTERDAHETALTQKQIDCINHWNRLLAQLPQDVAIPSLPIWGDEIGATYPFEASTPFAEARTALLREMGEGHPAWWEKLQAALAHLPSYARAEQFPKWKKDFIRGNRQWFDSIERYFPSGWVNELRQFPPSLRKLEWNCQGEDRDLWKYVLQFRPSGLRVKRYSNIPALVAMTTTQIPILGPERRFLTRIEGLRLQGFRDEHHLPRTRERAFAALGNAVHVGVVTRIAEALFGAEEATARLIDEPEQVELGAPLSVP